jgi:hypothetical protein
MENHHQTEPRKAESPMRSNKGVLALLVVIAILLAAVLATKLYTIASTNEQNELAEQRAIAYQ